MNFDYSDDQKFLKQEVRKFLSARCTSATTRAILDDDSQLFDPVLWREVVELGWIGAAIPSEHGGSGMGHVELCAIAEELGRVVAPIPFASTVYVFAEGIMKAGNDKQKSSLLPGIAAGEVIGCLATSDGPGLVDADTTTATVKDGRLSGIKVPVTDGAIATHAIVLAGADTGPGLFLVDLAADGVTQRTLKTLDPTRNVAQLTFCDTICEPLGTEGEGAALLSAILDRAAVLFAFEQVGGADRCLEMAKNYALERYAFGRVIGSYQAIKHKLADIYVKAELARSSAYYGAWALATDAAELPEAAAAARIAGSAAYDFAAKENLQTHGGMGFTWEIDCHLHLRRARQLSLALGGLPVWRERLVRRIERCNAA
ncbi:acyl-CoA/acyl-ACP dehydrogenase [Sphingomonas sp. So64.6b]|uniref:acyl-CoA dehydrogenase family protein n=1 Tax=Sphingomonas sp. So64.6b TaxID=2997354 RepID=UPI0016036F07|nr:acyl-CoA dehydrogenase family protein [Sphingomonas sp. So64.6b]QNA85541.1 acyl-CoA/acyl-ACP dehydrogenase [Sphingomonas sp. So64.6b]